jgi:hypothetical protein
VEAATAVSEPGHNRGMELLLHCLGGSGVPGQNGSSCLASRGAIEQHGEVVDDSTGPAASGTSHAR